eukprot:440308-Amphidinium_carterae.2
MATVAFFVTAFCKGRQSRHTIVTKTLLSLLQLLKLISQPASNRGQISLKKVAGTPQCDIPCIRIVEISEGRLRDLKNGLAES